jgi:hypothetical protein
MPQKYELFLDKNKKVKLAANDQGEFFLEANGNVVKINDEGLKLGKRDQGGENALASVGLSEAEVAAIAQENGYSVEDRITEIDLNDFFGNMRNQDLTYDGSLFYKPGSTYFIELNDYVDTPGIYRGVIEVFIAGKNSSYTPALNKKSALHRIYFTYINDGRDSSSSTYMVASDSSYTGEGPIAYKAFKKYVTNNDTIPSPTYGDFKDNAIETFISIPTTFHNIWANENFSTSSGLPEYKYGYQQYSTVPAYFPNYNPRTFEVSVRLGVNMINSNSLIRIDHSFFGNTVTYTNPIYDEYYEQMTYGPVVGYNKINANSGIFYTTYPTIKGKIILERVTDALGFGFDNLTAQP